MNGIVKKSMTESESKSKQVSDKLATLSAHTHACTCGTSANENTATVVMLERQISKNFAEINKMVLALDILVYFYVFTSSFFDANGNLKPDRTELQQLEESLESHFKLISGISQELVELRHGVQQSNDASGK